LDCLVIAMRKLSIPYLQRALLVIILMASSSYAAALGLGNIDVQSSLGEPLRATIKLEGETKSLSSACFKLFASNGEYPSSELRALITLREDGLGKTNLLIKSQQILNDPIVQLTLTADCENRISREYVLLLDPPLFVGNTADSTSSTFEDIAASADAHPATTVTDSAKSQTMPAPSGKPKNKVIAKTYSITEDVIATRSASSSIAESAEPRLILSGGGEYIRPDFIDSTLKLQMSFDLQDWPSNDTTALSADEVSDEVIAMANRLAYLETQMMALQQRNQELEKLGTQSANRPLSEEMNWATLLVYAFVTLVVIGFIGVAEWLRRRAGQRQIDAEVAIWQVLTPKDHLSEDESAEHMSYGLKLTNQSGQ
jgi:hypothetical protein